MKHSKKPGRKAIPRIPDPRVVQRRALAAEMEMYDDVCNACEHPWPRGATKYPNCGWAGERALC